MLIVFFIKYFHTLPHIIFLTVCLFFFKITFKLVCALADLGFSKLRTNLWMISLWVAHKKDQNE